MPDDDLKLRQQMEEGARAQQLLESPLVTQYLAEIEQGYIDAWRFSEGRDFEGRELAWRCLAVIDMLRKKLQDAVDDAKVAQQTLRIREDI